MIPFTFTLSCEELRLYVEFALCLGEFGRIGSSPEMEISLPLVGFSEEECRISLDEAGTLWLIRKGRELPIRIDPPSYFHAGPYKFLIREKVDDSVPIPRNTGYELYTAQSEKTHPDKELSKSASRAWLMTAVLLAAICLGGTAWYTNYLSSRHSEGGKQAMADPSLVAEKAKAMESGAAVSEPKKATEITPDPPKETDVQIPVPPQAAGIPTPTPPREQERMDLEKLAVTVVPCVFLIEVFDLSGNSIGKGTGFSVSADGLVATNHHVVENGQTYSLVTSQGAKFDNAEVVISDPDTDLALLKIVAKDLPFLPLAESSKAPIGKRVAVYGSPQGLAGSLSEGIISASERNLSEILPDEKIPNKGALIQTTAPISPGSSGSPLFDAEGKVIGVMTLSWRKNSQSLNFAVPVEALKSMIDRTKSNWSFVRPRSRSSGEESFEANAKLDAIIEEEPAYRRLQQQMSVKDWVESLKIAGFLVEKYPKSPSMHFQHGYCAAMLRLDHQAELSFTKAIQLDPSNQWAWNNLGLALSSEKQFQNALLAFEKAVSLNPNFPEAWENIVQTNVILGNWPKATTALDTLVKVDIQIAKKCASLLINLYIPDANFRQTLERALARKAVNVKSIGPARYQIVGVSPDDRLSVRSGPGVSFTRVISIANGAEVFVTGDGKMNGSTEWLPIDFGNSSGWVASKYLQSAE